MPPIDSYLYVLLSYILVYSLVKFVYVRFRNRMAEDPKTEVLNEAGR